MLWGILAFRAFLVASSKPIELCEATHLPPRALRGWYLLRIASAVRHREFSSSLFVVSLLALGAIGGLLAATFPPAQAMGEAPSTCNNRYDGTITSLLVTYPRGTLNPIATPNSTFTLYGDGTYNVTLTIHTQAQNSNQNTLGGTTWYNENLFGYYFGVCYPSENGTSIGPSEDVNISINGITHPCCSGYTVYQADFSTFSQLQSPVSFQINWEPASTTSTTTSAINTISIAHAISASSAVTPTPTSTTAPSTATTSTNVTASIDSTTSSRGSLNENSTEPTLTGAQTLAMSSLASYSSAPSSPETSSSRTSTASAINRSASQSLTATDILAAIGLGAAAVYAVGFAMIRRLR
jgi:hypothetical protein